MSSLCASAITGESTSKMEIHPDGEFGQPSQVPFKLAMSITKR